MLIPLNNIDQLPSALSVCLCYGKDVALLNTCFELLVKHYSETDTNWEQYTLESAKQCFDLDLQERCLFTNKRLIKLTILPNQLSEKCVSFFETILQNVPNAEEVVLLIKLYPQQKQFTQSKWYKTFMQQGYILHAQFKQKHELLHFLQKRQVYLKLQLSHEQLLSLIELYGEDYYGIENSLQLISLNQSVATDSTVSQRTQNSFALVDTILKENLPKALASLNSLYKNGVELQLLNWAIAYPIRQMIQLHIELKHCNTLEQACQKLNIWQSRIPCYEKQLKRHSLASLSALMTTLQQADYLHKHADTQAAFEQLEKILLAYFT